MKIGQSTPYVSWDLLNSGFATWKWSFNGPSFTVGGAGNQLTCMKRFPGETIDVDAILIEKVP